jgi:hypothetical protein
VDDADRAAPAVRGIVADLVRMDIEGYRDPSFAAGLAGSALALDYAGRALRRHELREFAALHIRRALDLVATMPMPPSLFSGFAGVAFAYELLTAEQGVQSSDENLAAVDQAIFEHVQTEAKPFDLVEGWAGQLVAMLAGGPRGGARHVVEEILRHAARSAARMDTGLAWLSPPELLPASVRELCPDGAINLGVAHGLAGVVSALAAAAAAPGYEEIASELLTGATEFLNSARNPTWPFFPGFLSLDGQAHPANRGWCYGDLGVAAALLNAAAASASPAGPWNSPVHSC